MSASMTESNNYNYQTPPRGGELSINEINNMNNRNNSRRPNNYDINEINPINLNNIFNEINIDDNDNEFFSTFNTRNVPLLIQSSNCNEDCPICLSSMVEGDIIRGNCHETHRFHRECIQQWGRQICPMCRGNL
jgi:hypothetical protein